MAKAVAAALLAAGFTRGTIVARNKSAGKALAATYGFDWVVALGDIAAPLLINVTPLGMAGKDEGKLAFPKSAIVDCDVAFDVVATPADTPLLREARLAGKRTIAGADVAVLQALEQFVLYTGIRPAPEQVSAAAAYARLEV
jgi:shikimate dehydrogenase